VVGLAYGWLRSRRPTMGAFPPAAQQSLIDIGLGGFVAAIGLANGQAALGAIQAHGLTLLAVADRKHSRKGSDDAARISRRAHIPRRCCHRATITETL